MADIGFQSGIEALSDWLVKMGVWQTKFAAWAALPDAQRADTPPPVPPKIAGRGPAYNPIDMNTWPWPEKIDRTLTILRDDHDAATPDGPPPPPPPTYIKVAPRVANKQGGSDARFCLWVGPGEGEGGLRPGVSRAAGTNHYQDECGATYDENGLCINGRRSADLQVPGLVGAREIDGRSLCSLPMVGDPTKNSGSWQV